MAAGAGGQGRLRASHADREQVIGALKAAFVQGMLAKDEFDAALIIPPPAMVAAAVITGSDVPGHSDVLGNVAAVTVLVFLMAWIAAGMQLIANWHDNRSRRGQLPPTPAPGGHAAEGGQPGNDPMLCQAHRDTRASRLLGHSVTQRIWRAVPTRRASAGLCT